MYQEIISNHLSFHISANFQLGSSKKKIFLFQIYTLIARPPPGK